MKKIIGVLAIALLLTGGVMVNRPQKADVRVPYTVKPNDTLWDIAVQNCPQSMDKRDYIDKVVQINNLYGCDINANQVIWIPYIQKN